MVVTEIISDIIAFGALVLAFVSFLRTRQITPLQKQVSELDLQIKEMDLANRKLEGEMKTKALCSVETTCDAQGRSYLRITNRGHAEARDVHSELLDEEVKKRSEFFRFKDIEPYECLQPGQSYDISVTKDWQFPDKFNVRIYWKDPDDTFQSQAFVLSF